MTAPAKTGWVQLNVCIPADTMERVKAAAKRRKVFLRDAIDTAIGEWLDRLTGAETGGDAERSPEPSRARHR